MARKKVNVTFITNAAKRKATFNKRKKGLVKKISEITTLCAIPACAVIFSRDETRPVVWPSNNGIRTVISKLREMPEIEQQKKMLCQESLARKNILKSQAQLKKLRDENRKREIQLLMSQYVDLANDVLENAKVVDPNNSTLFLKAQKLEEISKNIEMLQAQGQENEGESEGEEAPVNNGDDATAMQDVNSSVDVDVDNDNDNNNINDDDDDWDETLPLKNVKVQSGRPNKQIPRKK